MTKQSQHYSDGLFSEALAVLLVRGYVLVAPKYEAKIHKQGVALEKDGKGYILVHDYHNGIASFSSEVVITLYKYDNSSPYNWREEDILKGSVPFSAFDEYEKIEEFGSYGIVLNRHYGEKARVWIYDDISEANEIGAKRKEREEWHDFQNQGYKHTFNVKETPFKGFRKNVKIISEENLYRLINSNGREAIVEKWHKFAYGSTRLERA